MVREEGKLLDFVPWILERRTLVSKECSGVIRHHEYSQDNNENRECFAELRGAKPF
jgi:hypothetical protein